MNMKIPREIKDGVTILYGTYGEVRICDCLHPTLGLSSLPDNQKYICCTDPPYNDGYDGSQFRDTTKSDYNTKTDHHNDVKFYNDKIENYETWCRTWFTELKRISEIIMFTCGQHNITMWDQIEPYNEMFIHYKNNTRSSTNLCRYNDFDPILFYYYKKMKGFTYKMNVFAHYVESGFLREEDWRHSSPKPKQLYVELLEPLKPTHILDIFAGSGTSIECAEMMGVKYICYEIDPYYIPDLEKRIVRGQQQYAEYQHQHRLNSMKKTKLTDFWKR